MTRKLGLKIGTGGGGGGVATTVFGPATLNLNGSGDAGYSMRNVIPTSGAGGTEIRVWIKAAAAAALNLDFASVGISNGTASETTAAPVELLFSGGHGFTFTAGEEKDSDWMTLTTSPSFIAVVTVDFAATNGNIAWANSGVAGCTIYYKAASDTYNLSAPAGMSVLGSNSCYGVTKIEVR